MNFGVNSLLNDTIVAIAASGAISVVKLSGTDALGVALKISKKINLIPRYAHLTFLYDELARPLDKSLVIYFKAPASFTGEDVIEFQCHGGTALAIIITELCVKYGARIARAGEFSYRAVLNKKLTLAEAENASAIANAGSKRAIEALAANLSGKLNEFIADMRRLLLELLAYSETSIDYSNEDLPQSLLDELKIKLNFAQDIILNSLNASKARRGLFEGFRIALIGKPNVGKSSLLNSLLAYDRALVSEVAGTTRDTVEEWLHIGDYKAKIIDTAGIRATQDEIESSGIALSLKAFNEANIVIALFDSSKPLDGEDSEILKMISKAKDKTIIIALTKSDLEPVILIDNFANFNPIYVSKYSNNKELLDAILLKLKELDLFDGVSLVGSRQINALEKAYNALISAKENLYALELFSFNIIEAIESISEIVDPPIYDELLDTIFGSFCLGK